ncbi:hypothetical protein [Streptomyces sp. LN245]|uniref:hypothetical protein n=1 Tax=Streptomyces sp. LN245 TaxID=3112975 RepID=UPI003724983B
MVMNSFAADGDFSRSSSSLGLRKVGAVLAIQVSWLPRSTITGQVARAVATARLT